MPPNAPPPHQDQGIIYKVETIHGRTWARCQCCGRDDGWIGTLAPDGMILTFECVCGQRAIPYSVAQRWMVVDPALRTLLADARHAAFEGANHLHEVMQYLGKRTQAQDVADWWNGEGSWS
jgi:hypothetical protein